MNWVASYPANRKELYPTAERDGRFIKTERGKRKLLANYALF